jgi:hypothetical protein
MQPSTKCAGLVAGLIMPTIFFASPVEADSGAIPDFSGLWGRNAFNFEPMPSGPRPVTNLERHADGSENPSTLVGDYNNPILKPEAAAVVKRLGERSRAGDAYPDPSNQCAPYSPPFTFAMQLGVQILQTKDQVTFLYNQDDQVRRVRLNDKHPQKPVPTPMGDSVGHYEADTLVVDTIGIRTGPLAMVDRYGTPQSPSLHLIERYRLVDNKIANEIADKHQREDGPMGFNGAVLVDHNYKGEGLQLEFTVIDPETFTTPWSARITYRRTVGPWLEQVCAEEITHAAKIPLMPIAERPDF